MGGCVTTIECVFFQSIAKLVGTVDIKSEEEITSGAEAKKGTVIAILRDRPNLSNSSSTAPRAEPQGAIRR